MGAPEVIINDASLLGETVVVEEGCLTENEYSREAVERWSEL